MQIKKIIVQTMALVPPLGGGGGERHGETGACCCIVFFLCRMLAQLSFRMEKGDAGGRGMRQKNNRTQNIGRGYNLIF
jgi:hypothetical protein